MARAEAGLAPRHGQPPQQRVLPHRSGRQSAVELYFKRSRGLFRDCRIVANLSLKLYSGYGWWIVTCISSARTGPGTWRLWLAGAGAGLLTCTAASSQGEARVQTRLELRQQEEEDDDITAAPDQYDLTVMSGDISDAEFLEAMVVVSAVLGGY